MWIQKKKKKLWIQTPVPVLMVIGTLRSDNGDVHENVAEKQNLHHFKLFRDSPNSPCYLKEVDFGWS